VEAAKVSEHALPPLLGTRAVAERYGCDVRAARRIMREAGALPAAGRLLVRVDALDVWERQNTYRNAAESVPRGHRRARSRRIDPRRLMGLEEEWWKERQ
jgi:hypothetical protein